MPGLPASTRRSMPYFELRGSAAPRSHRHLGSHPGPGCARRPHGPARSALRPRRSPCIHPMPNSSPERAPPPSTPKTRPMGQVRRFWSGLLAAAERAQGLQVQAVRARLETLSARSPASTRQTGPMAPPTKPPPPHSPAPRPKARCSVCKPLRSVPPPFPATPRSTRSCRATSTPCRPG